MGMPDVDLRMICFKETGDIATAKQLYNWLTGTAPFQVEVARPKSPPIKSMRQILAGTPRAPKRKYTKKNKKYWGK